MRTAAPKFEVLRGGLAPFRRPVFRARVSEHPDPSDATGSLVYGGRYNPPGLFSVLNCSLDPWVAGLEVLDHHPDGVDELIIFELRVAMQRVLDFRDPGVIAALTVEGAAQPLMPVDLTADDLRLQVAIAALALAVGADGLLLSVA